MPAAFIHTPGTYIRQRGKTLLIEPPDDGSEAPAVALELRRIPIEGLDFLEIGDRVQITTEALVMLSLEKIPVHLVSGGGKPIASLLAPSSESAALRSSQCHLASDPEFALAISRQLIVAKIANQRRILQKLAQNRPAIDCPLDLQSNLLQRARGDAIETLEELRGIEGIASREGYRLWARFLPPEFPFERRTARPPENPVNACLSFGGVVVYHEIVGTIHRHGLDPGFGLLHATHDGRWSLALDLMEPFRPAVIEALTMRLLGHRILRGEHFESHGSRGGVWMTKPGVDTWLREYSARVQRPFYHRPSDERISLRRAFDRQTASLRIAIRAGDPEKFRAFTLQ